VTGKIQKALYFIRSYKVNLFRAAAVRRIFLLIAVLSFSVFPALAQDGEPVVVDEVVAQVNEGVITWSRVKREMKNAVEAITQQGKAREEAQRDVDARQNELIANLINEELLLQQGKELGLEQDVESEVNARFVSIMKEQNMTKLEDLYAAMRAQGLEPEDLKATMRKEITKGMVLSRDVDAKVYYGLTDAELKKYYDANKDKFKKPETITLSEIFLSFAGRNEADVKTNAAELVKQIRGGANFETLVAERSERPDSKANKGKVGTFETNGLNPLIGDAVKNVKKGAVTEPVTTDEGVMILRVDERTADSAAPAFDERRVREAITNERAGAERKKYMAKLRSDAYIKLSDKYRASVSPVLFSENIKN
jgi:parvulin-like peptidyl-prolyl isomerase